ncbi:hypothetical protein BS47DRAFT_1338237 [Hydnum rufescens UP504]|uniref:Uncharacterized protein n=1 Tax=Hydnum rufescens UP504 TaxID=1448309 RepID=A0A9P6B6B9_9AGAM|nr:hypothetical protein BS47DRAFT_1338237 [Hydnum rufescens UP504]
MPMPYYPPVSFDPTPDQFHRRGVMQPIRGSSPDGPSPTSLPPKAHPPPVVSPESLEPLRKPVVISPVILPQPQPQGPPVHIPPSPLPIVRSPTQRLKAQRLRTRSPRTPSSRERSRRSSPERSRRIQRIVDSDADSYSPPSPHQRETALSRGQASGTDSSQSSRSGSPRKPVVDEELQLNVSTVAQPTSSPQPNPNPPRASLPPAQRAVDSDADSYSPPSPHLPPKPLAERAVLITDFPQSSPSSPLAPPLPLGMPTAEEVPPRHVSTPSPPNVSIPPTPGSQP